MAMPLVGVRLGGDPVNLGRVPFPFRRDARPLLSTLLV